MFSSRRYWWLLELLVAYALTQSARAAESLVFEVDVRPILKTHCFHCHGEEPELQGGLDLRLVRLMSEGGDSGAAVEAGSPDQSLLLQRIQDGEMPPKGAGLSDAQQETIATWIAQGARTRRPEPESIDPASPWGEEERSYWAFQPVTRPALPKVLARQLVRSPIDAFVLSRLESHGLSFSPPADRLTLLRRLSIDLLGLPPSPESVAEFLADRRPDAYRRLVDRLLASPAYGERWARHWLDTAGYADSDGYTAKDTERPWAFRYRDYVIRSFNRDLPLNQFIIEQLAGDELVDPPYENLSPADTLRLAATGFLRMAPDGTGESGVDANVARNDVMAETIKIVSTSLLGMTIGCAQCHDHRYDPISHVDYYRFRAIFEPALDWKDWRAKPSRQVNLWRADDRARAAEADAELARVEGLRVKELDGIVDEIFEKEVDKLPANQQDLARQARQADAAKRSAEQLQLLKERPSLNVSRGSAYLYEPQRVKKFNEKYEKLKAAVRAQRPADDFVACLTEVPGHLPETTVFFRGDFNQPRQAVTPADLSVLPVDGQIAVDDASLPSSGRRLALARHLTDGHHPLTARVLANRVWMNHFRRGIVGSPGDFGVLGEKPTHPMLLDWLADELVRNDWQLKHLHRLLVCSTAYRQSSRRTESTEALDPENRWVGRMSVKRMDAEVIRDAMMEIAGMRTATMYGAPSPVRPDDVGQAIVGTAQRDGNGILVAKLSESPDRYRRTIYIQSRRSLPLGMLEPFDPPSLTPNCDRRTASTVPPQSLLMMNNRVVIGLAEKLAQRVVRDAGDKADAQFRRAWLLAFGCVPNDAEVDQGVAFLASQRDYFRTHADPDNDGETSGDGKLKENVGGSTDGRGPAADTRALTLLCQALLSSNRFLYVD